MSFSILLPENETRDLFQEALAPFLILEGPRSLIHSGMQETKINMKSPVMIFETNILQKFKYMFFKYAISV